MILDISTVAMAAGHSVSIVPLFIDTIQEAMSKGLFQNLWLANFFYPHGVNIKEREGTVAVAHLAQVDPEKGILTTCACCHRIVLLPIGSRQYLIGCGRGAGADFLYNNTVAHPERSLEYVLYKDDFDTLIKLLTIRLESKGYQVRIQFPKIF